jgi:hypothetical protein
MISKRVKEVGQEAGFEFMAELNWIAGGYVLNSQAVK